MSDDFSWTNRYYEPEEYTLYFCKCNNCSWESDSSSDETDLFDCSECPQCGGDLEIEKD